MEGMVRRVIFGMSFRMFWNCCLALEGVRDVPTKDADSTSNDVRMMMWEGGSRMLDSNKNGPNVFSSVTSTRLRTC